MLASQTVARRLMGMSVEAAPGIMQGSTLRRTKCQKQNAAVPVSHSGSIFAQPDSRGGFLEYPAVRKPRMVGILGTSPRAGEPDHDNLGYQASDSQY